MQLGVLVVDDSDLTREALRRALERNPRLKVIGEARTGEEAVALARQLKPHLVTMDLAMPGMGGLKAIEQIMSERPVPLVVVCERGSSEKDLAYEAISRGALELVAKSELFAGPPHALKRFTDQICALAEAGLTRPGSVTPPPTGALPRLSEAPLLIGLGASTGGPRALAKVLGELPKTLSTPIAIVQHMSADFFDGFLRFLAERAQLEVVRAEEGATPEPGRVYVGPPDSHLTLDADLTFRLVAPASSAMHCPSVNELFFSMARVLKGRAIAVLMTGMGADGAEGLLKLRRSGARTMAQEASTCAVAGMPQVAIELGAAQLVVHLDQIAPRLEEELGAWPGAPARKLVKRRVLVVDDSRLSLDATRLVLEDAGYEVRTLDNPLVVATQLRKHPVDLVLLDVNMPAVKGPQVLEVLRSHGLTTPVVLYSDLDEKTLSKKAAECGATGSLRKSGDPDALIRAVEKWIARG